MNGASEATSDAPLLVSKAHPGEGHCQDLSPHTEPTDSIWNFGSLVPRSSSLVGKNKGEDG